MILKPMLASDWDPDKVQFPVIIQPKIDGVRGLNPDGELVGRSFQSFANEHTNALYSIPEFEGFDGEFAAEKQTHPHLCSLTTSALNTIEGQPYTLWWVFDYVGPHTKDLPYFERIKHVHQRVATLLRHCPQAAHLRPMPYVVVEKMEELMHWHRNFVADGYEGSILRKLEGQYKNGRSTVIEGGLLRVKDFADCEGIVTRVEEGKTNLNELRRSPLGYAERSTHQENMINSGKIGTLYATLLEDQVVNGGKKVIPKGTEVKISAGRATHKEREDWFKDPSLIVSQMIKFQHFPHGVKDKLRMATYQSIRMKEDMS